MVDHNLNHIQVGTKVKLKRGQKFWEYHGVDKEGNVILLDPDSKTISIVVKAEEIDWKSAKSNICPP